jgi:hypothetical protein
MAAPEGGEDGKVGLYQGEMGKICADLLRPASSRTTHLL